MRFIHTCRAVVADAEELHMFPSSSFGAVTCLAGLMFFTDHERYAKRQQSLA